MFFARKHNLEIIEIGSKQSLEAVTDYPITDIDFKRIEEYEKENRVNPDAKYPTFPFRKVRVISYDRDKYCWVEYKGELSSVKRGYCYLPKLSPIIFDWCENGHVCIGHNAACALPFLSIKD